MPYICELIRVSRAIGRATGAGCLFFAGLATFAAGSGSTGEAGVPALLEWPAVTQTMRPWTRWWWVGNAVDVAVRAAVNDAVGGEARRE